MSIIVLCALLAFWVLPWVVASLRLVGRAPAPRLSLLTSQLIPREALQRIAPSEIALLE
jgi:hypothetical protein